MKLVLKNTSLKFEEANIIQVQEVFGNDVEGMALNSYLKRNGGVQLVQITQNYAVTPFINCEGVASNIDITYVFSAYDDKVYVAFYSDASDAAFISAISRVDGQGQGLNSLQILLQDVPAGAKYLRFNAWYGTAHDSSAADASVITFDKTI
jgi:hypothetical protein